MNNKIGFWKIDSEGLPCFEYTGKLPYKAKLKNGQDVKLPEDPWFLLGNYRFTMFIHVSGEYELISGQRSWARINHGEKKNGLGGNFSCIKINEKSYHLSGIESLSADPRLCRRTFGIGFAEFIYEIENIIINKTYSVAPSKNPYDGKSEVLLEISIKNKGETKSEIRFEESMKANFKQLQYQFVPENNFEVKFDYHLKNFPEEKIGIVSIKGKAEDPLIGQNRDEMSKFDFFAPSLFMKVSDGMDINGNDRLISAISSFSLEAGEEKNLFIKIGYSFDDEKTILENINNDFKFDLKNHKNILNRTSDYKSHTTSSAFSNEWKKIIPSFSEESDEDLRRELQWHAYNLEAMATYSEYYGETKIPQGTIYDYLWGMHASARDNYQHALPLVYYNKALAKSILKYMLERTTSFGEIRLIEYGNGCADNERYFTSDQQLYYLLYLSEYLRVTKDFRILEEKVRPFPVKKQTEMTVLELTEKCFIFLRDTIGTGSHGLVRLMNSDWNDAVYYIEKVPYNNIFFTGESHMNSAMAITILQNLIPLLQNQNGTEKLCESMTIYREKILTAFIKDLGNRKFPRRMYFNNKPYGDENMFLEPMGFTLEINELSDSFKKELFLEMQKRIYNGEKLGAREQENPEFDDDNFDKGSRENGGFWWALNGPVITAVSKFDKDAAKKLLKKMTLKNCAESFPEYWSSYWSGPDNLESSLIPEEGLPDQSLNYSDIPVYCAHPHAWILYSWFVLNDNSAE